MNNHCKCDNRPRVLGDFNLWSGWTLLTSVPIWYNYMFYLGLLVLPCTHMEGPRSPQPVGLFTLNHRVFCFFVVDRHPSSQTVVPHPGPSSLVLRPTLAYLL